MTSRSLLATLVRASSSRLRAPETRTSRPLTTTTPSSEKPWSQSTTRSKGQPPPSASAAHLSAGATHSTRSRNHRTTAVHNSSSSSSAPRQQQQQYSESESESSQTSPSTSSREKRPLLRPYELSRRLIALCNGGDVDLAVAALQRAPRNAQNIKVWNTIIQQCMSAKKYKLAFRVFTDMKRRGFVPNVRTYATMMSGYATVDDWNPLTAQLGLVHSVYDQLRQHLKGTRNSIDDPADESSASFSLYPIALYISILGKAGKYQKAFDVFHALDTSGTLAPNPKIYGSLLSVLARRVDATDVDDADVIAQSVSEAKYVWRRHMRSLDSQPEHNVESRSVESIIKLLARGEPTDHELMFDILRDFCGLPSPSDDGRSSPSESPPSLKKKVWPTTWILNEILDGCIKAGRPEMAVHYAQSVMDTTKLRHILRARHLHNLLSAHILLSRKGSASVSPSRAENVAAWVEWMVAQQQQQQQRQGPARGSEETRPNQLTIIYALELCNRSNDMHSALRIARAMIFDNDSQGPTTVTGTGTSSSSRSLPVRAWEHLFHVATRAGQDEKRQCFELLNTTSNSSILDVWKSTSAIGRLAPLKKNAHILLARHIVKVLKTVLPSSDHEGAEKLDAADLEAWSDIRKRAQSFLGKTQRRKS